MNLSREWLSEFVDVGPVSDRDFAEAMTLSGSKVETYTDLGAEIKNVVVGRILSMERHPNSDHMWVCQVSVGERNLGEDGAPELGRGGQGRHRQQGHGRKIDEQMLLTVGLDGDEGGEAHRHLDKAQHQLGPILLTPQTVEGGEKNDDE